MMKQCLIGGRVSSSGLLSVLVLGCAALAIGCETVTEKLTQKATEAALEHALEKQGGGDVKIDSDNHTVTVKSDKGKVQFGAGGKVPDDWPKDVPIYPGATVKMSLSNAHQQLLALETPDSTDKAVEFYKSKLASMKQEGTMATEQQTMLGYKDDTGRHVQLSIGKDRTGSGTNTTIALIINPAKKPMDGVK